MIQFVHAKTQDAHCDVNQAAYMYKHKSVHVLIGSVWELSWT